MNLKDSNNPEKEKKASNTFIISSFLIAVSFFVGFYFSESLWKDRYETSQGELSKLDLMLLGNVIKEVSASYVDSEKIDKEKMTYGIVEGAVRSIGDPYTVFFDPKENKQFKEDIAGSFNGIGVQVGMKDEKLKVIAPIKDSPADKAGILPGDIILQVNKESIQNMPIDEVISKIKGQKGTKVGITISRGSDIKEFDIVRDVIKVPTIELKTEIKDGKKIAHLRIYHFSEQAYADFRKEIPNLKKADGIILDMRNNPGGLVDQTQQIASWFLEKGAVVFTEQDRNKNKNNIVSFGYEELDKIPMVMLVNEGSASASEIMAGALRDDRQIKIIGKKSFGKGSVQKVVDFPDGSSVKVTIAKWFTPNGTGINDIGITPDIEVKMTDEDYSKDKDPQLDKAFEEIIKVIK